MVPGTVTLIFLGDYLMDHYVDNSEFDISVGTSTSGRVAMM
jgi:hypothetical protein